MEEVYLDYNATTPVATEVLNEMMPFFTANYANPSSDFSQMSLKSQSAIKLAQSRILNCLEARHHGLIFTSGATESINLSLFQFKRTKASIFVSKIDHDASVAYLKDYPNTFEIPTNKEGEIQAEELIDDAKKAPKGSLFSFILAHNELGTVLELEEVNKEIKKMGHFIHIDATQAIGKIEVSAEKLYADFLSFSGHKVYAPKGVGGLIFNSKTVSEITPLIIGGGQQNGLRGGTLNTPFIAGLGKAFDIAKKRIFDDSKHYENLRDTFLESIKSLNFTINGSKNSYLKNTLNLTFNDWSSYSPLALKLSPFIVSQASACSTGKAAPRVLNQLNIPAEKTIRVSFGRYTTKDDVLGLAKKLKESLQN